MAEQPDLSVHLGRGLRLRSPVMVASGTFGYGFDAPLVDRTALGAIVTKGTTPRAREGNAPTRIAETPSGMLNAIGLQNPGVDHVARIYAPMWAAWDVPVIVNVAGDAVDDYVGVARRLDGVAGVAGLELNISCPNIANGLQFGIDPRPAAQLTTAVRAVTRLPLLVKLTPNVTDIVAVGRAVEDAGGDRRSSPAAGVVAGKRWTQWAGDQATRAACGVAAVCCTQHPGCRHRRDHDGGRRPGVLAGRRGGGPAGNRELRAAAGRPRGPGRDRKLPRRARS